MTEVTGRLRWDEGRLYLGTLLCAEVEKERHQARWQGCDTKGDGSSHPTEQAARDALFARVKAAITEETP